MKISLWIGIATCLLLPACLRAADEAPNPARTAKASWPGVSVEVGQVVRLDADSILVAVRLWADGTAKNPTLICGPLLPGRQEAEPFSLETATLVDQATGQEYKTDPLLPDKPYLGNSRVITNLYARGWLQLAVRFKAPPPPPPDAQGRIPAQKVSFLLPSAREPIRNIELPPPDGR